MQYRYRLAGDLKQTRSDEVAEWIEELAESNYNTVTLPYGPRFSSRKIEKLLFQKDLLLNAEWNRPKDREVNLHRHPAFFGKVSDIIGDCCGFCPEPRTDEEKKVAEEESKYFIKGDISFMKDNPGRQAIGSFNPITETDWTELAYVSDAVLLCQAAIASNVNEVCRLIDEKGIDPNGRDVCLASHRSIRTCNC